MIESVPIRPEVPPPAGSSVRPIILGDHYRTIRQSPNRFFLWMGLSMIFLTLAGFFPSYFAPVLSGQASFSSAIHIHFGLFFGWVVFYTSQSALVQLDRVTLHRRLGILGAALAVLMVAVGVWVAIQAGIRDVATGNVGASRAFLLVTLTDIALYAGLVLAAILRRRQTQMHRRLMFLATVALMPAALGRLLFTLGIGTGSIVPFTAATLFLVATGMAHDRIVRGRIHRAYWVAGFVFASVHVGRIVLMDSAAWHRLAEWIIG